MMTAAALLLLLLLLGHSMMVSVVFTVTIYVKMPTIFKAGVDEVQPAFFDREEVSFQPSHLVTLKDAS